LSFNQFTDRNHGDRDFAYFHNHCPYRLTYTFGNSFADRNGSTYRNGIAYNNGIANSITYGLTCTFGNGFTDRNRGANSNGITDRSSASCFTIRYRQPYRYSDGRSGGQC
jgi:hypothetical protein